jgi:hypothetical protein
MLRLGREVGLESPDSYECTWSQDEGQQRGIIVRLFLDSQTEELNLGSALAMPIDTRKTSTHGGVRLAPLFDPASCLGAELQEGDKHLSASVSPEAVQRYAARCGSGFGDGKAGISLQNVVEELRLWPEWKSNASSWVADFGPGMDTVKRFLPTVPSTWLPDHRKRFALGLLEARLSWLQSLL